MMYKGLIIILTIMSYTSVHSQVSLEVVEIKLSNFLMEETSDETILDEGPFVLLTCQIWNNTTGEVILSPSKSIFRLTYNYDGKVYFREIVPLPFSDVRTLKLLPNEKQEFSLGDEILLGTDIFNDEKRDYTLEMLQIIPTLSVIYKDSTCDLKMKSSGFLKVTLK